MNELEKMLLNIRSLRAFAKELTLTQLEDALGKFTTVVDERRQIEEQLRQEQQEKEAKLAEIAQQISQQGLDVNDLVAALSSKKATAGSKRKPRPAKYQYVDGKGKTKTWTGQGRTPVVIQEALDNGQALEEFLIQ
ncbi:H-NS family nucleoid-associated regulatory protein [Vibrio proteolyticus]|uniref:DNA-binding protein n=1 Tax=Vibrio proteolyticus NBRC 13287 TaxID=1219065 RepID=U3A578_VIBPR|nr:H-NS family nucleoid-associated regulatory protein [Vibrio proteolyticus]GAD68497.1 DNA-binding protein H-NS [Vibrio proteolyticus NBRC 13287]